MKKIFLKYLLPLFSALVVNLGVIIYWSLKCNSASSMMENFFYCPGKEGYAIGVHFMMWSSIISIFIILIILLLINLMAKNKKVVSIISKILLGLGILVFISSHYIWIPNPSFREYEAQREKNRQLYEQRQEEYLESDKYKRMQEEAFQKSCELAKENKLENPNVLIPVGCE